MMSIDEDCRRLLSLLAHEMRSPGAVVAGYLRMLKGPSTSDMPGREQKMIEEANRSCARLLHIVQELSDFGELSSNGDMVWVVESPPNYAQNGAVTAREQLTKAVARRARVLKRFGLDERLGVPNRAASCSRW